MEDKMNLRERLKLEREQHEPITDQMVDDLVALAKQKRSIDNKELTDLKAQVETLLKQRGKLGAMLIQMMSAAGTDKQEVVKNKASLLLNELTYAMSGDFDLPDASGEDSRRLDWLESQNHTWWWQVNIKGDFGTEITLRSNAANGYRTAREAIDAAMQPDRERAND